MGLFNVERDKRRDLQNKIYAQFKTDLFEELGISDNPKKDKLFSIARELGHSDGYSSVAYYAEILADLIL